MIDHGIIKHLPSTPAAQSLGGGIYPMYKALAHAPIHSNPIHC